MVRRWGALAAVVGLVAGLGGGRPPAAQAACHRWDIAVQPAGVAEGGTVTVTLTRDAGINPSSMDVTSIDETATASSDYAKVQRTVSMTTETEQSFTVAITDDAASEGAETFRLHMGNPQGCAVNPNFQIGPDARVMIAASDAVAAPTTTAASATTAAARTTTTHAATTSTTAAASTTTGASSTTEVTVVPETAGDDDGGTSGAVIAVVIVLLLAALGGIAYVVYRRRRFV